MAIKAAKGEPKPVIISHYILQCMACIVLQAKLATLHV